MRNALAIVLVALGCGSLPPPRPPAPTVEAPAAAQPAPAAEPPAPAVEEPVGAVPIPGETPRWTPTLDEIDTTVTLEELPKPTAKWPTRRSVKHKGRVLITINTMHESNDVDSLWLTVVDTVPTESGFPNPLEHYRLGTADTQRPGEGDAFTPHHELHAGKGDEHAPLKFAIRLLPRAYAPESERMQIVAYTIGTSVFVVDRLLTAKDWRPRLRVDMPRSTEIIAVNPGWH